MALRGFIRNFRPLEILIEDQVDLIHKGCLDILETTGVRMDHQRALKLFEKYDCNVDYDENRVRIPPGLVEECLRKVPSSFHLKARDPKNDLRIGGNTVYFSPLFGTRILDLESWEHRQATRNESADAVKILDALDNCHYLSVAGPYSEIEGIPPVMQIPERVAAKLRGSTKTQSSSNMGIDCDIFAVAMAKAVGAEVLIAVSATPPLTWSCEIVDAAIRCAEAGVPVYIGGAGEMGAQAPATFAGALQSTIAAHMAGIVLMQLVRPGAKVVASEAGFAMDMQSGIPKYGAIESSLHMVPFNQIWRKYGIPTSIPSVGSCGSKGIDFQLGYEKAIGSLLGALSGANLIPFMGGVYSQIPWHPVQAILDDEIAGMIGRFLEGIVVDDETLATDLIEEVGPVPGMYLDKEHTRKWWKREQFMSRVADRLSYPEWLMSGKKSALNYAEERMEEILATHKPEPLTASQEEEIEKILQEARNYYKSKAML